ncbi:MAG TPA: type II toxin-antitoxin system VapC family toxin [Nitrospirota bacterium]|jgi:predicted nucleic acid-binding protein|nr:type II toxin-antitoxin system VapC family toxin [Nitrospirota bacterium]
MNLVDSCGWLEYLADGPNAVFFAPAIENTDDLIVPTLCILEVFKRVLQQKGEDAALQAAALMQQGQVIDLDSAIAVTAAKVSHEIKLPLADAVIVATARILNAVIWTQDSDLKGVEGVKFVNKR